MTIDYKAQRKWWQHACIYQIYPASFCQRANYAKGVGDLPGILEKLDYVKSIGVDAIWVSPFFESPNYDMGYDISDYQKPDPSYGSLAEIEAIISGCHERGMKILFDLVINHTSHLHPWFIEARKSKDNPYRHYYFWLPPRYDEKTGERLPPTNWKGEFGGSAWTYDETTDEYYLSFFTPQQPDLNWESEAVRNHIYEEAIIFWLDKGVDGFRIDTAAKYSKHPFYDVPITDPHNYVQPAHDILTCGPRLSEFLKEMTAKTFERYGSVTIGELGGTRSTEEILEFVHQDEKKFSMMIRFDLPELGRHPNSGIYPKTVPLPARKAEHKKMQEVANPELKGWLCSYFENHDQPRAVSAWCDDSPEFAAKGSKMLITNLVTLSGTVLLYQGQEYGHVNMGPEVSLDEYKDIMTIQNWRDIKIAAKNNPEEFNLEDGWKGVTKLARDHARNPIQWDDSKNAGFSSDDETWMIVNDRYKEINIAAQENDPDSVLNFTRKVLALRKQYDEVFVYGHFHLLDDENPDTFLYTKTSLDGKEVMLVALNWTGKEQPVDIPQELKGAELLISSAKSPQADVLEAWEGRCYLLKT